MNIKIERTEVTKKITRRTLVKVSMHEVISSIARDAQCPVSSYEAKLNGLDIGAEDKLTIVFIEEKFEKE